VPQAGATSLIEYRNRPKLVPYDHEHADMAAHEVFMQRAISLAEGGDRRPGCGAVGCVIVMGGQIVGEASNEADLRHDPTAHAEITALRRACSRLGTTELRGATLYCTLQPCGMCTMASIWARIGRIVFGAGRHQVHASYFEGRHLNTIDFINDAFRDDLEVLPQVLSERCASLYYGPNEDVPLSEQTNV
jgi:tRNA(adenine34) deaminase